MNGDRIPQADINKENLLKAAKIMRGRENKNKTTEKNILE